MAKMALTTLTGIKAESTIWGKKTLLKKIQVCISQCSVSTIVAVLYLVYVFPVYF